MKGLFLILVKMVDIFTSQVFTTLNIRSEIERLFTKRLPLLRVTSNEFCKFKNAADPDIFKAVDDAPGQLKLR